MKKTGNYLMILFLIISNATQLFGQNTQENDSLQVEEAPIYREIKIKTEKSIDYTGPNLKGHRVLIYYWSFADEEKWNMIGQSLGWLKHDTLHTFEECTTLVNKGNEYMKKAVYVSAPIILGSVLLLAIINRSHSSKTKSDISNNNNVTNNDGITPYKIQLVACAAIGVGGFISYFIYTTKAYKYYSKSIDAYNAQIRLLNGVK